MMLYYLRYNRNSCRSNDCQNQVLPPRCSCKLSKLRLSLSSYLGSFNALDDCLRGFFTNIVARSSSYSNTYPLLTLFWCLGLSNDLRSFGRTTPNKRN